MVSALSELHSPIPGTPANRKNKDGQPGSAACAIQLAFWITHLQCVVPFEASVYGQVFSRGGS